MADTPRIGERLSTTAPVYIKHPPAASAELIDGAALDAGAAMIYDSNASMLSAESCRHLVCDVGAGTIAQGINGGYANLTDAAPPADTTGDNILASISWDGRTARRYGPFALVADRILSSGPNAGRAALRQINVVIDCNVGALNSLALFVALTAGPSVPSIGGVIVSSPAIGGGLVQPAAGRAQLPYSLLAPTPPPSPYGNDAWTSRNVTSSTVGSPLVSVQSAWLWVGWLSSNAADAIYSISAYETR